MKQRVADLLSDREIAALSEIKRRVSALFPVQGYYLFGSKARGDAEKDSDVDLLILTERELSYAENRRITHEIFEVNLEYDTLFSYISLDGATWNSKLYSYLPIHAEVMREGLAV